MLLYTGSGLKKFINSYTEIEHWKRRFCFKDIYNFAMSNDLRTLAIFGLRRTGKTVLTYQLIKELDDYDNICYIRCSNGDDMADLRHAMDTHEACKYYIVDEITKIDNFINTASILADHYAYMGKRIIMAGTDSLGFAIAKGDELLDRVHIVHTTYIPYDEYHYLLGRDIDDYIIYGGTLSPEGSFYNDETCSEYLDSSIANNIQHSLEHIGRNGKFGSLLRLYEQDQLTTFINRLIEAHQRKFTLSVLNKKFKSHDLGSAKNLIDKLETPWNIDHRKLLDDKRLLESIAKELQIKDKIMLNASTAELEAARGWLEKLDVIHVEKNLDSTDIMDDYVVFTQPGLRYCMVSGLLNALEDSNVMAQLTMPERTFLISKIDTDVRGQMLEDIIKYTLMKNTEFTEQFNIISYREYSGIHEFDMVCIDKKANEAFVFEIKHAATCHEGQIRHLINDDGCAEFEKLMHTTIIGKGVIYTGPSLKNVSGIRYFNAGEFLMSPIQKMNLSKIHNMSNLADNTKVTTRET